MSIHSAKWRALRDRVLQEERACWLCGQPLDFDARPRSRWSPSVDHVIPRSAGGDEMDRANLRAAHYGCNSGKRERAKRPELTSRRW